MQKLANPHLEKHKLFALAKSNVRKILNDNNIVEVVRLKDFMFPTCVILKNGIRT